MPDLAPHTDWVQILGRIAIHIGGKESKRLTGSGQRLLSVLVASGRDGTTAERIAEEIWGDEQPNPWRPALRMAVARLRKQLPPGWDIVSDGGVYRIMTGDGWIDAWRLDEVASTQADISEDDLQWMLAGAPFGDVDLLELVASSTQHLRMLQITIAERFCAQEPESASTAACTALTSLVREHPYNDRLAVVVGRSLAAAGRRTEALVALNGFADVYTSEFGAVPTDIANFLASDAADDGREALPTLRPTPAELPKELRPLADAPLFGREDELEQLRRADGVLVLGAIGSGKSRLLAALIADDLTVETTYVVGDDRLDLALGPFAVAMPGLRDELLLSEDDLNNWHDRDSAERAASTRAWRIVLAHLEARSSTRPQRLIVDDAHLLDAASLGLLRLLVRSNTKADLNLVVGGRSDYEDIEWTEFVHDAERAGLSPVVLEGLEPDVLEEMVYLTFPDATREARQGLAADVYDASAGLPAVAGPLIAAADPLTLALPEQLEGTSALARVTAAVSERAPEVVAAAAVLGHQFSIGALIELTDVDEAAVFDTLDELWSTGLIVETDDPDQVRFRHVLVQRAFLEGVPRFRRGHLHHRAAELTSDLHERADHQANAGALIPADVAAASLRESAALYARSKQWRKVARQLRRADELPGEHLDEADLTRWAAALDQTGADGSEPRRAAYRLAAEAGNWAGALDAALSGLPEAELPDGDRERIDMLERIADEDLPPSRRFDRHFHLSRQSALAGDHTTAVRNANLALSLAVAPDEIGLSHVCRWTASRHVEPTPYVFPDEVIHQGGLGVQARIAQMSAISAAERGDYDTARAEAARFDALAVELGDPLRIWHSMGLKSMFLLNEGDFDKAELFARQALDYADLHGMQQATSTYFGQKVHSLHVQGRLHELGETLEPYRVNMSMSALGRAAVVLCDLSSEAAAEPDLEGEVRTLVAEACERQSAFGPIVIVFLSRAIPLYAPDLASGAISVLEPFGDNPLVAGFGAGDLGPAVSYVAHMTTDESEKRALCEVAVGAADHHGQRLWQVLSRLELAELGVASAAVEAATLARGTGLESVVERRMTG